MKSSIGTLNAEIISLVTCKLNFILAELANPRVGSDYGGVQTKDLSASGISCEERVCLLATTIKLRTPSSPGTFQM